MAYEPVEEIYLLLHGPLEDVAKGHYRHIYVVIGMQVPSLLKVRNLNVKSTPHIRLIDARASPRKKEASPATVLDDMFIGHQVDIARLIGGVLGC